MRRLLYIPIIHSEADLGRVGEAFAQKSAAMVGDQRWVLHQETVHQFWEVIRDFFVSIDPDQLKVYQDGLAADGAMGRRIAEKAAERGSKNYRLILELLGRGAELRKTEDPVLRLQEYENIIRAVEKGAVGELSPTAQQDRLRKDCLTKERDRSMAETIGATLQEGEIGAFFVGAEHDVATRLPVDISVSMVKDRGKVRAYFEELFFGQDDRRMRELSQYLSSPASGL